MFFNQLIRLCRFAMIKLIEHVILIALLRVFPLVQSFICIVDY